MLSVYNSLTRKTEPFKPIEDMKVKMYTCGPSTYQRPHIGNYRTFLFEDVLQRYLEYLGYHVTRLITLTDVEDKAIAEARKERLSVEEQTQRNEAIFFRDFELLRIKMPDYKVRASSVVEQAAQLVKTLVATGYAYWYTHKGTKNTYFSPLKFAGFGKLAHLNISQWPRKKRRFHLDTYPGTPWNKGDFILWHGCKKNDSVCWDTEIGRGRPAWNIQDAAMVTKHLGFSVDVACGGVDNLARHHDYTLAVAEAVSGKAFARYWLHGAHLLVDGKKMSKSKGNVYYVDDLLAKGFRADHIRFFLIYGSYSEKLNFTFQKLAETSRKLDSMKGMVEELQNTKVAFSNGEVKALAGGVVSGFERHMDDDLNVKAAFDKVYEMVTRFNELLEQKKLDVEDAKAVIRGLRRVDSVLQVIF
ncbi:class I tRNA ligase family protein [Candidatus Bathyarchaeota archaeon A05DMB-2]|nr:class I tRNA ligase family protein [Candidatus Bathyarchaeota archaeon A05DMB-2]